MNLFSIVRSWFGRVLKATETLEQRASKAVAEFIKEVDELLPPAEDCVKWVGEVVVAIQTSHLPISDIIEAELKKFIPTIPDDVAKEQAGLLAIQNRPDMLLNLATMALQYSGFSGVKLRILRAAIDIAYGVYAAKKGI